MSNFIHVPYGQAVYGEKEIQAVAERMRTTTQMSDCVREMEAKVSGLFAKNHGIMVNSGSSANYLAVEVMNLPKGSEVITPVLTFSTTVAPLVRLGLIPVFVDVEPGTYNINVEQVESMITDKTRAIMIPNLLGNLPDWEKLDRIAKKHNLITIEDSADTLGATINGEIAGRFTDISTTSFYGSHVINCAGNGGMVCINNDEMAKQAVLLRSWGRSSSLFVESEKIENRFNIDLEGIRYDAKFVFETFGYNLEPSEIGAAFGLVQLEQLQHNIDARTKWFNQHTEFFKQYEDLFILPKQLPRSRTGWLAFALTVKDSAPFARTELQIFLEKRNIQTRPVFTGNILRQPCFTDQDIPHVAREEGYPEADHVMRGGILLACHHGLNDEQVAHLYESIALFVKQQG